MRIIHKNLQEQKIKISTETLDDLWHLKNIIDPGDLISSITWRRPKSETDKIRPERRKKERVKVIIQVEKTEFHEFANRLRILGEIIKGQDKGEHHTLNVDTNSKLTIIKEWKDDHLQRLEEAQKASKRPKILLIAVDNESATFGLVRQYGLEKLTRIESKTSGKLYESERESTEKEFYNEIISTMKNLMKQKEIPKVIIAGPGFTKKEIHSHLKEKEPNLAPKVSLGNTSTGGKSGLNEIIKRGIVKRVSKKDRISFETELLEKLMNEITENGLATYGIKKTKKTAEMGAIKHILIADEILRKKREKIEPLLKQTQETGGKITILSTEHEAGKKLMNLGGIGALLRYKAL
ncbi:MAG: mRNA surveillance protein pelota [Hadesarchaea archaeon]|nr:mRNA surveillance protein pelota [Hadesarchaea archaeon]